jgi:hypothetical protein
LEHYYLLFCILAFSFNVNHVLSTKGVKSRARNLQYQLLAFQSSRKSLQLQYYMDIVVEVFLSFELGILMLHFEQLTGPRILGVVSPFKRHYFPICLYLRHNVFVFASSHGMSFRIFPLFSILCFYMVLWIHIFETLLTLSFS